MTKILTLVTIVCVVALSAGGVAVLLEVRGLVRDVRTDSAAIAKDTTQTMVLVREAAAHTADASQQASLAAAEQRAYWQKTSVETYKTMASLRLTIVRTDKSLNDVLVPQLAKTLNDTDVTIVQAGAAVSDTQKNLQPSLINLARASAAAADAMADPHLRETLANVDATSLQTAVAMQQLAGVAANAKTASDLALARLRDALRPQKLVLTVLEKALGLAAQGAQVWYGTH
jgi:hypothetical protein